MVCISTFQPDLFDKVNGKTRMVPTIFLNSVRLPGSGTVRINQDERKHNVRIEVEMENGTTLCGTG
jgi:hypothetical protein